MCSVCFFPNKILNKTQILFNSMQQNYIYFYIFLPFPFQHFRCPIQRHGLIPKSTTLPQPEEVVACVTHGHSGERSRQAMRRKVASEAGALNSMSMATTRRDIRKVENCMMVILACALLWSNQNYFCTPSRCYLYDFQW